MAFDYNANGGVGRCLDCDYAGIPNEIDGYIRCPVCESGILDEPEAPKPGRNDPCTCGSGKKYKKCCGKAA